MIGLSGVEEDLKSLASPAGGQVPDVTGAMTGGGTDVNASMELQCNQWIGTSQSPGVLNEAPLNLEPGLGITRPAKPPEPEGGPAEPQP